MKVQVAMCLLLVAMIARNVRAQSCVPYDGSPLTGGKCDSLVSYSNVFLPQGMSYEEVRPTYDAFILGLTLECLLATFFFIQLDYDVSRQTFHFSAFVPTGCRNAALRLVCLSGFVKCEPTAIPQGRRWHGDG